MTYSQAKVRGQRSVGSEDRVETNGRTDGGMDRRSEVIALLPTLMRSVINALTYRRTIGLSADHGRYAAVTNGSHPKKKKVSHGQQGPLRGSLSPYGTLSQRGLLDPIKLAYDQHRPDGRLKLTARAFN